MVKKDAKGIVTFYLKIGSEDFMYYYEEERGLLVIMTDTDLAEKFANALLANIVEYRKNNADN